jgi:Ligand-gated ion channel
MGCSFRFLLPRERAASTIDQFILPFETLLWRATALVLTLAVVVLSTSYWMGRYFEYEEPGMPLFNLKESLLVLYGSLFAQGHDYIPNSLASRMVIWMCYIFGVCVSTAYGASLINKLTLGTVEPPFKTMDDLLGSAYTVILSPDSAPYRLMMVSQSKCIANIHFTGTFWYTS